MMQEMWARVLAGEVLVPGAYSMKTLDCIRNMSASDATIFEKVAMYILANDYLINSADLNVNIGISYNDILTLDDLGLKNSSGIISKKVEVSETSIPLSIFEDYIIVASASKD